MTEHIDATGTCRRCGEPVEHMAGIPDPYWRHMRAVGGQPHGVAAGQVDGVLQLGGAVDAVRQLGGQWSPDFEAYAAGQLDAAEVRCVLCGHAPCDCPPFGTPEYFALVERRHGKGGRS